MFTGVFKDLLSKKGGKMPFSLPFRCVTLSYPVKTEKNSQVSLRRRIGIFALLSTVPNHLERIIQNLICVSISVGFQTPRS
jgi:hypothetical protein